MERRWGARRESYTSVLKTALPIPSSQGLKHVALIAGTLASSMKKSMTA